jgi:cytochrome b involved in lipid metabolism
MSKVFSFEEVAKHNKSGDAWLVIKGNVYDGACDQFLNFF